jgi:hypothetical protein
VPWREGIKNPEKSKLYFSESLTKTDMEMCFQFCEKTPIFRQK